MDTLENGSDLSVADHPLEAMTPRPSPALRRRPPHADAADGVTGGFVGGGWRSDSLDLGIKVPSLLAEMYVAMVAERASALAGLDGDMHTHMHRADDVRTTCVRSTR
jgi:hypothetical protein